MQSSKYVRGQSFAPRIAASFESTGARPAQALEPSVRELLNVDSEFRALAGAGRRNVARGVNRLAPATRPVLVTVRGARRYAAAFSDSLAAEKYGRKRDWVVLTVSESGMRWHYTVVTAHTGWMKGRRIVRSREHECALLFASRQRSGTSGRG